MFKGVSDGGSINSNNDKIIDSHLKFINNSNDNYDKNDDDLIESSTSIFNNNILGNNNNTSMKLSDDSIIYNNNSNINSTNIESRGGIMNRDKNKLENQVKNWGSREDRMKKRNENINIQSSNQLIEQIEQANFADWSTHSDDDIYFSFTENCFYVFENYEYMNNDNIIIEEGYKAVTEGIPRSLSAAMCHPVWGEAARKEFEVITKGTGAIVKVNQNIAKENIKNGADCLIMLAVYEEKVKDGKTVKKVRMVANGKQHKHYEATYSPTPSREEFLIILHICAAYGWDYYWLDEQRAFLTAERNDKRPIYVKFQGDYEIYGVEKALYGTKDAPRDYHIKIDKIMYDILLCEKLHMCSCVYIKCQNDNIVIILDHVDDFVFAGNNNEYTCTVMDEFRKYVNTDDPVMNASLVLGIEFLTLPGNQ
jgi:hypothetical protein